MVGGGKCTLRTLLRAVRAVRAAVGRCPGALATALLLVAEGVRDNASLALQRDLRLRLLSLFSGESLRLVITGWCGIMYVMRGHQAEGDKRVPLQL